MGWYDYPVAIVYAPDGRTAVISKNAVQEWKNVGWYDYPVVTVYASDGKTAVISKNAVQDWKNVGWYDYPVVTMYAPDGRTAVISKNALNDWLNVGWYVMPEYSFIYKTGYVPYDAIIHKYYKAMDDDGKFDSGDCYEIKDSIAAHFENDDPHKVMKLYYALYDVDKNGVPELIFSEGSRVIDIYTMKNGIATEVFEDCLFDNFFYILQDGTLVRELYSGRFPGLFYLEKLDNNGSASVIERFYYSFDGPEADTSVTYVSYATYNEMVRKYREQSVYYSLPWKLLATAK